MSDKSKKKKAKAEPTPETEQTVPETEAVEEAVKPEAEEPKKEEKPAEEPKAKTEKEPKAKAEKEPDLKSQLAAEKDKYLRLLAEYDNFRKRSQKEKDALYGDIKANTVTQFLPVYDNLERALKQNTEDEAYKKGVEMIMTQFCTTLEKMGVTEIKCLGEKFDPTMHNAVMHVDDEEKGENEIVEVFQKGFKLGDKVIRFAMVKVAN